MSLAGDEMSLFGVEMALGMSLCPSSVFRNMASSEWGTLVRVDSGE